MQRPFAIGVDGARGGWIAALDHGERTEIRFASSMEEISALGGDGACPTAIDVPIGIPRHVEFRPCDVIARARLGVRRNSVFMPPGRVLFGSTSFAEIQRRIAELRIANESAKGLSRQAFELLPKIEEVDAFVRGRESSRDWLIEVHPELCFMSLNANRVLEPKGKSWGRVARTILVGAEFVDFPEALRRARLPSGELGDALDAYAALWTARRFGRGDAETLGGETDNFGVIMRMVV